MAVKILEYRVHSKKCNAQEEIIEELDLKANSIAIATLFE
jgi:hypothetical protein